MQISFMKARSLKWPLKSESLPIYKKQIVELLFIAMRNPLVLALLIMPRRG